MKTHPMGDGYNLIELQTNTLERFMAEVTAAPGDFVKSYLVRIRTLIVGGMLIYELYTGDAVASARSITRARNPIRYWIFVLIHSAITAVLVYAWVIGVRME